MQPSPAISLSVVLFSNMYNLGTAFVYPSIEMGTRQSLVVGSDAVTNIHEESNALRIELYVRQHLSPKIRRSTDAIH